MSLTDTDLARSDFAADWQEWHERHEQKLAAPHGFLAITSINWLTPEPQRFADAPGSWSTGPDGVVLELEDSETVVIDGVSVTGRHEFGVIPERGGVNVVADDAVIEVARRGGNDIVRPRHPDNALLRDFRGTPAFTPDPTWVVRGRWEPFDPPRPVTVGSVVEGLEHVYDSPGRITFEIDGEALALTAFGGPDGSLTILFTDATSGVSTYAANRSLRLDAPAADGTAVLDFNRAANLPCAYTDLATCPLPPAGNHLPVAVGAGEQIPLERRR